jgi:hypothetical protein
MINIFTTAKSMPHLKQITRFGAYGIILKDSQILLTQKKFGPYKDQWGLPGGY